jgi:hypothetical protein
MRIPLDASALAYGISQWQGGPSEFLCSFRRPVRGIARGSAPFKARFMVALAAPGATLGQRGRRLANRWRVAGRGDGLHTHYAKCEFAKRYALVIPASR